MVGGFSKSCKERFLCELEFPRKLKAVNSGLPRLPSNVAVLVEDGHEVLIEKNAGKAAGMTNREYEDAGAQILPDMASVFGEAEMVLKVKEILPPEYDLLRDDHVLFTYIHSAIRPEETQVLLDANLVGIAYEDVMTDDGEFPLLTPMSEIAGEMGMLMGIHYMATTEGGNGVLIGGAPGVPPAKIAILGVGHVGIAAARYALGLGADVTLVDVDVDRLRKLRRSVFSNVKTLFSSSDNIRRLLPEVDMLVNAVKWKPGMRLVSREMLHLMKANALIVDIDCEPNGAIETCRFTTHDDPVYVEEGIRHYCVPNLPSAAAFTASHMLSNATLPYVREIAKKGVAAALQENHVLRRGLGFCKGRLTFKPTADAQKRPYTPAEEAVADLE